MLLFAPVQRLRKKMAGVMLITGGSPDEVADAVLYLLSEQASYVNDSFVDVSGVC